MGSFRYVDETSDLIAEIVNDDDELVLRLQSSDGARETGLEAREHIFVSQCHVTRPSKTRGKSQALQTP